MLLHTMNPDINVTIRLFDWISPQWHMILFTLLPFEFCALFAKTLLILSRSHLERFPIMIYIFNGILPTHVPVSPSYNHPWKGHWMHWLLTTFPPMPKCTPMWAQYACNACGFPSLALKTAIFYPAISTAFDSPTFRSLEWTATYHPFGNGGKGLPIFFFFWSYLGVMTNSASLYLE